MIPQVAGLTRVRRGGPLTVAIPRGTLLDPTLDLLESADVDVSGPRGDSRALIFEGKEVNLITMRPSDVPTYVESGAADVGITGKDVLLEQRDRPVYELLDLRYGECRMVVAAPVDAPDLAAIEKQFGRVRIATKYLQVAGEHFQEQGRQAELVEVKGSVELAPLVGLSDAIVDLVASGRTLAANGLEEREHIVRCTARFVANRVSHKLRATEVDDLASRLDGARARLQLEA